MKCVEVAVPVPEFNTLTYEVPESFYVQIGDYVRVTIRSKFFIGIVVAEQNQENKYNYKIIKILEKLSIPPLSPSFIKFIKCAATYNMSTLGSMVKLFINEKSFADLEQKPQSKKISPCKLPELSAEQDEIRKEFVKSYEKFSVSLIDGETGSGKTEIYCSVISDILNDKPDAQILILIPEIALVRELIKKIKGYFHNYEVIESHSSNAKNKAYNMNRILTGKANITIGTRSALFKPYKNLKLIIVDEEHDDSFKNEQPIDCTIYSQSRLNKYSRTYNARDMAILLASQSDIPIILSSATPSLETYYKAIIKKYTHYKIKNRFGRSIPPKVIVENTEKQVKGQMLTANSLNTIVKILEQKKQVLIFLNKRGYAPVTMCSICNNKIQCEGCSSNLNYYKKTNLLICTYCNKKIDFKGICPCCNSENSIKHYGSGIEKVEEEVTRLFPDKRIAVLSSDTKKQKVKSILENMSTGKIDILIGTQIVAKGHNFKNLNLVVIADAEISMNSSDLRSGEKTYQLLHQVAGRSGRYEEQGTVIIQTRESDGKLIEALKKYDKDMFYEIELESRKMCDMPPFSKLRAIIIADKNNSVAESVCKKFASYLSTCKNLDVMGPIIAPLAKINHMYRYRILIKTSSSLSAQLEISKIIKKINSSSVINIDIDPITFL